jgi:diketogulonate reductase-like aldo/keto reductase
MEVRPMGKIALHSLEDRVEIAPGVEMTRLGIGTFRSAGGYEVEHEVAYALRVGYRGVDTASMYGNEEGVGRAIARSGLPRDSVFLATKVWNDEQGYDRTLAACERSLRRLGVDHVDLYLIHWPVPGLLRDTWRAMERLREDGQVRAIGVCNFLVPHIQELLSFANVPPAVDQVEHHPRLQQPDLRTFLGASGITMQAWAPIMRGGVAQIPEIVQIAAEHRKTPAQVTVRWILQHGVTTIPKSVHEARIDENADVFAFELTDREMAIIDGLDRAERLGRHPDSFGWASAAR